MRGSKFIFVNNFSAQEHTSSKNRHILNFRTRRSKIVSRATGRYAATSFDQLLHGLSKVLVCGLGTIFFCPLRLIPIFDRLALLDRPRFSRFPKKVMKKVITHHLETLSVYPAIQSMFFLSFFAVHV